MDDREPPLITLEAIRMAKDCDVEQAIVDSVVEHMGSDTARHYEIFTQMPVGFQVVFSTWVLEGEVGNGGFLQYFYNTRGDFVEQGLEALTLLGVSEHASVLDAAMSRLNEEIDKVAPFWRQGSLEGFLASYKVSRLGELDERWYALDDLGARRIAYIRDRIHDFGRKNG